MMKCTLCGFKFDEMDRSICECNCGFSGCGGDFLICPECGYHMVAPPEIKKRLKDFVPPKITDNKIYVESFI